MSIDNVARGLAAQALRPGVNKKIFVRNNRIILPNYSLVNAAMASPPTITSGTSSSLSGSVLRPSLGDAFHNMPPTNEWFTYTKGAPSLAQSNSLGLGFNNVTVSDTPSYGGTSFGASFMHTGTSFEIILGSTTTSFLIKVNDQYVSLTPTTIAGSGSALNYYKYAFSGSARRRIDIIGYNLSFCGVNINPTDTLSPAPIRGPRTIIMGDSFQVANLPQGISTAFGDVLGWDDVWASGVGGTGYLATNGGTAPTLRQRFQNDVAQYAPEVIIFMAGQNDWNASSASAIGAEVQTLFAEAVAAFPNAVIAAAPSFSRGVNTLSTAVINGKNAVKAAALATGVIWLDLMEMPVQYPAAQLLSGTIGQAYSAGSAGSSGIWLSFAPPAGSTIQLDTTERIETTGELSQIAPGLYNIGFDGVLQYNHASGAAAQQVGGALFTGHGYVGATTGYGNSDLLIGSDGVHPSVAGSYEQGQHLATALMQQLAPN